MNTISEKRIAIEAFLKAVDQASFVLKKNPELVFSQVYNRVQWQAEKEETLKGKLLFRCQYCLKINQIEESSLGHKVKCSSCGHENEINPFTIHKFKRKPWWKFW